MRTLYLSTSQNLQRAWFIGEDCKPTQDFQQAKKFESLDHFFGWVEQHRILLAEGVTYATDLDTTIGRTDFILCYNNNIVPDRGMCSGTVQHSESKRPVGLITTLRRIGLVQSLLEKKCLQHFEGRLVFVRQRVLFDSFVTSNGEYSNNKWQALIFADRDALDEYIKDWQGKEDAVRKWYFREETRAGKRLFNREQPTKFWYPIHQFKLCRIHVTNYNTIEFVRVYSEDINSYADVINKIFLESAHDDKPDAVATALRVYSGTRNPYMKTLEKYFLNSMYGTEGWHWTPDGPKPVIDSRVGYDLSVPRWELAKSKFELDYSNHPDYSKNPEFLTKCFNMPYNEFKTEVLGDFEPPAERIDYTKMYKHYDIFSDIDPNAGVVVYNGPGDYRKQILKKLAERYAIPYGVLEAADIVERRDDDVCLVWDCKESKLKLGKNPAKELEKGENDMRLRVPEIKKVIFNKPAVIVMWKDGTKTVVKAQGKSRYDKEKGLAMAIAKKALGNEGNYYNEFRKWLEE